MTITAESLAQTLVVNGTRTDIVERGARRALR